MSLSEKLKEAAEAIKRLEAPLWYDVHYRDEDGRKLVEIAERLEVIDHEPQA